MKKRGHHQSIDKELKRSILWLESLPFVKRVILGFTESCRHHYPPGTLRYQYDQPGGMRIIAYGGKGVVSLFVAVDPPENHDKLIALLQKCYS